MRQQRERQQIAVTTIADRTKIQLSLLESMERDDVSRWPSGIFRRAFIRAYAQAIALDPDVVVKEFLERYPDPVEDAAPVAVHAAGLAGTTISAGPPMRLRYAVGSALAYLSRRRSEMTQADDTPVFIAPPSPIADAPAADEAPPQVEATTVVETAVQETAVCENLFADDEPAAPLGAEPDLEATARLCTEIGRVGEASQAMPLLEEAARLLNAVGVIVWQWEPQASELRPALACGYSNQTLAQLPTVRCDADNATAAAFRSAQTCRVKGTAREAGALVVPMLTAAGCVGVVAAELQHGNERKDSVHAALTIFAAQFARLVAAPLPAEAAYRQAV
jgi:hypothetical protein